jgi:hypothetical protein
MERPDKGSRYGKHQDDLRFNAIHLIRPKSQNDLQILAHAVIDVDTGMQYGHGLQYAAFL